ncbi:MAG: hypothetical protein MUE66_01890 [Acidimicrobiia bacterium]|jgi:hypothetical protein|nr:hypothetical protein [Acidimicrobiia bacterium]
MTSAPEPARAAGLQRFFNWLGFEITLGTLIAVLSVFTALSSYQGSMADSDQNKGEVEGMQVLNDANAEYLTANQEIIQDYTNFDSWYLNQEDPDLAEYYQGNFSPALLTALGRSADDPFDDAYYEEMYTYPSGLFDEADTLFGVAQEHDERGDRLQLVVMMTAVGLAFAAWASLLDKGSRIRLLFAALAIVALALGAYSYFTIPPVSG